MTIDSPITLIKLGGSLITDKNIQSSYKPEIVTQLAQEIQTIRLTRPDLRIIIGHGSGSFGHYEAKQHNTIAGVQTAEQWYGFARVAVAASQLSQLISQTLLEAGIPILRVQPSASVIANDGLIQHMFLTNIETALSHGLVPLVHGDVALDSVRGGTITSTETIFAYIAQHLPVNKILLVGLEDGVYDQEGKTIPHITPSNLHQFESTLGGSSGVDVTGGMYTKVLDMLSLARIRENLSVQLISGTEPNVLKQTLLNQVKVGTLITAS